MTRSDVHMFYDTFSLSNDFEVILYFGMVGYVNTSKRVDLQRCPVMVHLCYHNSSQSPVG